MERDEFYYRGRKIERGTMLSEGCNEVPLRYTEVRADVVGMLADVTVIQHFRNGSDRTIEAVYLFPLPHSCAVSAMEMKMGERVIRSEIREREEAARAYIRARDKSWNAALLEQERPNLFTVSVANIEPRCEIVVTLRYHEVLPLEDNQYELVFPTTFTPRYIPGMNMSTGNPEAGIEDPLKALTGQMESVPDAGRLSAPIQNPISPCGREINIFVSLDPGFDIGEITSPSHRLYIREEGMRRLIQLACEGEIPNRDFILRFSPRVERLQATMAFHREKGREGSFLLQIIPQSDYLANELLRREMIFVLDRSGSMAGAPIMQARKALKALLRTLGTGDFFSILAFDDQMELFDPRSASGIMPRFDALRCSCRFNQENLSKADRFLDGIDARGGTEIGMALNLVLRIPAKKGILRQIVFLTDGAVGNEDQMLQQLSRDLGGARTFMIGIGPSINRYLIDEMAKAGRGAARFITSNEDIEEEILDFANQISFPVLSDLSIDCEGGQIAFIYPTPLPDLYRGQILSIIGRFYTSGVAQIMLTGNIGEGRLEKAVRVDLPEVSEEHGVIETLWARRRIDALLSQQRNKPREAHFLRDEIIGIAVAYHLMSPYTSLVAIETGDGEERSCEDAVTISVPSLLPEGLNYEVFHLSGGHSLGGSPYLQSAGRGISLCLCLDPGGDQGIGSQELLLPSLEVSQGAPCLSPDPSEFGMGGSSMSWGYDAGGGDENSRPEDFGGSSDRAPGQEEELLLNLVLKWLVRNQCADGCWSLDPRPDRRAIMTSLALLAFIGRGHTNRKGKFTPQISRAIGWLGGNVGALTGLSAACATWVFAEISDGQASERESGLRLLQAMEKCWSDFRTPVEKVIAAYAAISAVSAGLGGSSKLAVLKQWLLEDGATTLSHIVGFDGLLKGIRAVMSGKEEVKMSAIRLISGEINGSGDDSGKIIIDGMQPLDATAAGAFILSWRGSTLRQKSFDDLE